MVEHKVVIRTRGISDEKCEELFTYLNTQGWDWETVRFGPQFKEKVPKKKSTRDNPSTKIPDSKKEEFIAAHVREFRELHREYDGGPVSSGKSQLVKDLALDAKNALGYSLTTSTVDIINSLYKFYLSTK